MRTSLILPGIPQKTLCPLLRLTASCIYTQTSFHLSTSASWRRVYSRLLSFTILSQRPQGTRVMHRQMASKMSEQCVVYAEEPRTRWMTFWARILWAMMKTTSLATTMVLAMPTASMSTGSARMGISMYSTHSMESEEQPPMVGNHSCINRSSLAVHRGEGIGGIFVSARRSNSFDPPAY